MAAAGWSSLPSDLINRIADCLLATNDVDYYMDFRAVCTTWRRATDDPKNNQDPRFRPSRWIVIDEVRWRRIMSAGVFQSGTHLLVNTTTGRVLRKDLPLLRKYYVIATTPDGFFVLADRKSPHAASVLNPFTGCLIRFMAPMTTEMVVAAAVIGSSPTLVLFSDSCCKLYKADADSECFDVYGDGYTYPSIRLAVLGAIYAGGGHASWASLRVDVDNKIFDLMRSFTVDPCEILAIYPSEGAVDPSETGHTNRCFLVESAGEILIIMKLQQRMEVFKMDTERNVVEPVKSIGNSAIFLGYRTCLSINADKFPSIDANCIYYAKCSDLSVDIYMYDLKDEKEERISGGINAINHVFLFNADPPFTIIQLLSSYTINAWDSELAIEKKYEGLSNVITNVEAYGLSSYLEDIDFDD